MNAIVSQQYWSVTMGVVLVLVLTAATFWFAPHHLRDPDTLWHIRTGLDIWASGGFPHTDPYSHSFAGSPWIAKEWGSQLLLAGAYSLGGWTGVIALTAATIAAAGTILYRALVKDLDPLVAFVLVAVSVYFSSWTLAARPHLFALPFIILFVHGTWSDASRGRAPRWINLLWLWAWANLHASFTLGFVFAAFAAAQYFTVTTIRPRPQAGRWLLFLGAAPLVTLIHPYGHESILSTFIQMGNDSAQSILEWTAFSAEIMPRHALMLLVITFAVLISGFRLKPVPAMFTVFVFYLFLEHARFVVFFFMLTPIIIAGPLAAQFATFAAQKPETARAVSRTRAMRTYAAAGIGLFALVMWGIGLTRDVYRPNPAFYPKAAIEAARAAGVKGNVMNAYNFGGALIFEDIPTFIDGRADRLFDGLVPQIQQAQSAHGAPVLQAQIETYNFNWALLPAGDGRLAHFAAMANWQIIYEDQRAVVLVRDP